MTPVTSKKGNNSINIINYGKSGTVTSKNGSRDKTEVKERCSQNSSYLNISHNANNKDKETRSQIPSYLTKANATINRLRCGTNNNTSNIQNSNHITKSNTAQKYQFFRQKMSNTNSKKPTLENTHYRDNSPRPKSPIKSSKISSISFKKNIEKKVAIATAISPIKPPYE